MDYENNFITYEDKAALRNFVFEGARQWHAKAEWSVDMIGSDRYVYKMYIWQGRAVGVFLSVEQFMKTVQESDLNQMSILLLDHDGRIWGAYGETLSSVETGASWRKEASARRGVWSALRDMLWGRGALRCAHAQELLLCSGRSG